MHALSHASKEQRSSRQHTCHCRARRLVLAYQNQAWFEPPIAPVADMLRAELDGYTFRQLPRFVDEINGRIDAVQSGAILRHLGRKYGTCMWVGVRGVRVWKGVRGVPAEGSVGWDAHAVDLHACSRHAGAAG